MAANTYIDWSKVLKDRIGKMSPDGLFNTSHHDTIMNNRNRSLGNQSGSKLANITLNAAGGGATSSAAPPPQPQRSPSNATGSVPQTSTGGSTTSPNNVISSGTNTQSDAQSGGDMSNIASAAPAWGWGDSVEGLPFDYQSGGLGPFSGIAAKNLENVSNDAAMQRRLWSQHRGGDRTTEQMLGNFVDANTLSHLYGMGKLDAADQLKFMDAFGNYSTSAIGDGSNYLKPRDIMGRMIEGGMARDSDDPNAAPLNNSLAEQLGANSTADVQIDNFLTMMDQSVQFLMNERTYAAYKATIEREAQRFLDYRMSSEGTDNGMTFAQWLNQRLGPNAGL